MNKTMKILSTFLFFVNIISAAQNLPRDNYFSSGIQIGYYNGFNIEMNGLVANFAEDFPLAAKFKIGYTSTSGGNALDARKIFINNNTNGVADESGYILNFGFDFLYSVNLFSNRTYLIFGPRYTIFSGFFNYIGGNEEFDVTSSQWGIGTGLESYFRMSTSFDLVLHAGYDFFFPNDLYGHDTTYNPDNININPREDYTYSDADAAINQPKHMLKFMIGFNYNF